MSLQSQFVFTLPACGFVVALNLDWCPDANGAIQSILNGDRNPHDERKDEWHTVALRWAFHADCDREKA
jgi:hypothetical protein